jgi:hypothetical protein
MPAAAASKGVFDPKQAEIDRLVLDMERLRREVSAEKKKNVKVAAGESDEVPDELRCPISERFSCPALSCPCAQARSLAHTRVGRVNARVR